MSRNLFVLPPRLRVAIAHSARPFSVLHRPPPKYEGHVPLNAFERATLAAGSAVISLMNPRRGGMFTCQIHTVDANLTARLDRGTRRNNRNADIYLPSSRRNALKSNRQTHPS